MNYKCPSCKVRFPDGAGVKAHVRAEHNSDVLADMAKDGINHLTPSFRPMKDVFWEDIQRLRRLIRGTPEDQP